MLSLRSLGLKYDCRACPGGVARIPDEEAASNCIYGIFHATASELVETKCRAA